MSTRHDHILQSVYVKDNAFNIFDLYRIVRKNSNLSFGHGNYDSHLIHNYILTRSGVSNISRTFFFISVCLCIIQVYVDLWHLALLDWLTVHLRGAKSAVR